MSDASRDRFILIVTTFLAVAALASLVAGAIALATDVATYNSALATLTALGKTATAIRAPEFYPLRLLCGAVEQIEIVGAVIAILIGYRAAECVCSTNTCADHDSPGASLAISGGQGPGWGDPAGRWTVGCAAPVCRRTAPGFRRGARLCGSGAYCIGLGGLCRLHRLFFPGQLHADAEAPVTRVAGLILDLAHPRTDCPSDRRYAGP